MFIIRITSSVGETRLLINDVRLVRITTNEYFTHIISTPIDNVKSIEVDKDGYIAYDDIYSYPIDNGIVEFRTDKDIEFDIY